MVVGVKLSDNWQETIDWLKAKAVSVPAVARRALTGPEALAALHHIGITGMAAVTNHTLLDSCAGVKVAENVSAVLTLGRDDTFQDSNGGGTRAERHHVAGFKWEGGKPYQGVSYGFFYLPKSSQYWFSHKGLSTHPSTDFLTAWLAGVEAWAPKAVADAVGEELKK